MNILDKMYEELFKEKYFKRLVPLILLVVFTLIIIIALEYFIWKDMLLLSFLAKLFEKLNPVFSLLGVTIALYVIFLTITKINQTQKQIEILSDNNKFNNFYKHREVFIQATNNCEPFNEFIHIEHRNNYIRDLYNDIYYSDYSDFMPYMNNNSYSYLSDFLTNYDSLELTKDKLDKDPKIIDKLISLADQCDIFPKSLNLNLENDAKKIHLNLHDGLTMNPFMFNADYNMLVHINNIMFKVYFKMHLINFLFSFDGENRHEWDTFRIYYDNLRKNLQI